MQGMLTLGAVNTFVQNPDALFNHGKNCHFADFLGGARRMYFPWDLDASRSGRIDDIYPTADDYADILLAVPELRERYTTIMWSLLLGPMNEDAMHGFLDAVEPVITPSLEADPNNQIGGSVAGHFDTLRGRATDRVAEAFDLLDAPVSTLLSTVSPASLVLSAPKPNPSPDQLVHVRTGAGTAGFTRCGRSPGGGSPRRGAVLGPAQHHLGRARCDRGLSSWWRLLGPDSR